MKKNDGTSDNFAKLKNLNNWGISKTEEKLKLKIFNFLWWRDPPYKNDDFFINFFTIRVLFFID